MDFEAGGVSEIEGWGGLFYSLDPLSFEVVNLLDLLVSDFRLSPLKLPVFRLFDKTLPLDSQAALKEAACDL